jgi:LuxR family maltose regulon positive regulatory protein
VEAPAGGQRVEIPAESDAWFAWLETARSFAFDDPSGHFTARKKRRMRTEYWYAIRKRGGKLNEAYLGKARDVTLGRLRAALVKLNQLAGGSAKVRAQHAGESTLSARPAVLRPPRLRPEALVRTHAVDRLAQALERPLTLVSAPAGYGKTTVLAQWAASSRAYTAWLSLEVRDNDPVRLWRHVAAALDTVVPRVFDAVRPPADAPGSQLVEAIVAGLIAALSSAPAPTVLILDDVHVLDADNAEIHSALAYFIEHLPPHVHLVLASRTIPLHLLGKLRARRQVFELRVADLRLTRPETGAFVTRLLRFEVPEAEIADLWALTEGRVLDIQLAALALKGQVAKGQSIAQFAGDPGDPGDPGVAGGAFDALALAVVGRLPSRQRSLVLQAALLDRLSSSLCDAVTQSHNGWAPLEELQKNHLFLQPLDDSHEWYRFHPLFADALRRHLRQTQPGFVPQVYARASVWCEANHCLLEAIDYAFAAEQIQRAAQLLEVYAPTARAKGYHMLMRERLERLPDVLLRERPRLCVAHAYALYMTDDHLEFSRRVHEAEEAFSRAGHLLSPADRAVLEGEILCLRAYVEHSARAHTSDEIIAVCQQALALLPHSHPFRNRTTVFVGIHQLFAGDVRAANATLSALMRTSQLQGDGFYIGLSTLYLGLAATLEERLDDVLALCSRAAKYLPGSGSAGLAAGIALITGKVDYERDALESALDHLRGAAAMHLDPAATVFDGCSLLAHVHLALGNALAARQTIERAIAQWTQWAAQETRLWAWTGRQIEAHRARLWLLEGDLEAAAQWARELERRAGDQSPLPTYVREWEQMILARVYLAEDRADDALALLGTMCAAAEAGGRVARMLEMLVLQAAAYDAVGNLPAALSALRKAVELGAPQRVVRPFLDGGLPIQRLLSALLTEQAQPGQQGQQGQPGMPGGRRLDGPVSRHIELLLDAFTAQHRLKTRSRPKRSAHDGAAQRETKRSAEALTHRELEVVRLIAGGASNNDIADALVISPLTAKRHISNIFVKLGVNSRTQAVAHAREHSMLDIQPRPPDGASEQSTPRLLAHSVPDRLPHPMERDALDP